MPSNTSQQIIIEDEQEQMKKDISPFQELCIFISEHENTPLTPEQTKIIGPTECMYRDSLGHGIYDLWQRKNPNIEMPEPMKRYNPYTAIPPSASQNTPATLTIREYGKMITAWIHYWHTTNNHIDLPENLRGNDGLLLHEVAYIEPYTYCKPAIMWLAIYGNDDDMPEYIKPNCPYKNGVDKDGNIQEFIMIADE